MPNTPRLALPYPVLADTADVPRDISALATKLDTGATVYSQGTFAARPAAGVEGRFYYATDQQLLYYDSGTAWVAAGSAGGGGGLISGPVLDVGVVGQLRAGRQLALQDFTNLGLSAPIALWNLSDLSDVSGNGRNLTNKGAVPFGPGVNGVAATAAVFAGSTGQVLYIVDTGAADPFRIRTGSLGCWFRTAKRGVQQMILSKYPVTAGQRAWWLDVGASNAAEVAVSTTGVDSAAAVGTSDAADDRWHFAVATHDGTTLRLYVDGTLEAVAPAAPIFPGSGAVNIGAYNADAATASALPFYGRVDEAFVTADVLTEDEVRSLYAAKLAHGLGLVPTGVRFNVHRKRKGAPLAVADFTTQPLRLHNFTAAALTDQGSGNVALVNNGAAISTAGADGTPAGAFSFAGAQSLSATDAGLPAALTSRSYGCWFKESGQATQDIMGWGTMGTGDARIAISAAPGNVFSISGADAMTGSFVGDGQWHQAIVVEDNAAGDGVRRKLYVDGRLAAGSTVLNAIVLLGANRFRVGAAPDGTRLLVGQVDGAFVCGYALTAADVLALYAKGSQDLGVSPKNAGDHVERVDAASALFIGDTLESQHTVELGVVA